MAPTDFLGEPWADLCARLTRERRLQRWAKAEPALAGLADLEELAAAVHGCRDLDYTDELFAGLLRLAAADKGNDQDAGLVVAHLMHNGVRAIAVSLRDLSADIDAVVAGELWVQIRSYRWRHRRRGHALGLKQDTRAAVLRELCPPRTEEGRRRTVLRSPAVIGWISEQHTAADLAGDLVGSEGSAEDELLAVLIWARGSGVLSAEDVQLLLDFELAALPERYAVADAQGVGVQTLRRRCRKAKARLHEARLAYLEQAA